MSRAEDWDAEATGGLVLLLIAVAIIVAIVVVYAVTVVVLNAWRIYSRFHGTPQGRWLWGMLAALGAALAVAALLAQVAPAVALWLAAIALAAWMLTVVGIDAAAGPDTRWLGGGDLLAPWKPVARAA